MRKLISYILLVAILFLAGCATSTSTVTANFYYCSADPQYHTQTSVIQAEQRKLDSDFSDLEGILQQYIAGPDSGKLISPFPAGTAIKAVQPGKDVTVVVLTDHLGTLSGVELMIACACLATTILEISQSEAVHIRAENVLLNNQEIIAFTEQNLLSFY